MKIGIQGLQETQRANARHIRAVRPNGALADGVKTATMLAQQSAIRKTHVDTGALRASHRMQVAGRRGLVYIDPSAVNPRSGARTSEYGPAEHARGGDHAFYQRVVEEDGERIARAAGEVILRGLR